MSFFNTIKEISTVFKSGAELLKPYFVPSYNNLPRITVAISSTILIPLADYLISEVNLFKEEDNTDNETKNINSETFKFILGTIIISAPYFFKIALTHYLTESVNKSIKKENANKIFNNTKFLLNKEISSINSFYDITLGHQVDDLTRNAVPLCIGLPLDIISIGNSFFNIYKLSSPSTSMYSIGLSFFGSCSFSLEKLIARYINKETSVNNILLNKIAFIQNNAEQISLTGASNIEYNNIISHIKSLEKNITFTTMLLFSSILLDAILPHMANQFFDIYLPDSGLLLKESHIQKLNSALLTMLLSMKDLSNKCSMKYTALKFSLEKVKTFSDTYKEWEKTMNVHHRQFQKFEQDVFSLENFSIFRSPSNGNLLSESILNNNNISLTSNKVYMLLTSFSEERIIILKALINSWPYSVGIIKYPATAQKICFIPQKFCIPPNLSLLEIILYPLNLHEVKSMYKPHGLLIQKIKSLLKDNGILYSDELENNEIHWSTRLNADEIQKLAIIGAVIKQPGFLIIDESTSELDKRSKKNIYNILKKELISNNLENKENSIIIYTDRHPTKEFPDNILIIDTEHHLRSYTKEFLESMFEASNEEQYQELINIVGQKNMQLIEDIFTN